LIVNVPKLLLFFFLIIHQLGACVSAGYVALPPQNCRTNYFDDSLPLLITYLFCLTFARQPWQKLVVHKSLHRSRRILQLLHVVPSVLPYDLTKSHLSWCRLIDAKQFMLFWIKIFEYVRNKLQNIELLIVFFILFVIVRTQLGRVQRLIPRMQTWPSTTTLTRVPWLVTALRTGGHGTWERPLPSPESIW